MDLGTLVSNLQSSPTLALLAVPLVSFIVWNLWSYFRSPIGGYPGPFLARKKFSKNPILLGEMKNICFKI